MSDYGWIIDRDHIVYEHDGDDYKETIGPRNITREYEERLRKGEGLHFRIYDDDGNRYYSGRYIGPDDDTMFGPLDDFGRPNDGANTIKYEFDGKWEEL